MEKVLITGIAGGQGRLLASRLMANFTVCGVDWAPWHGAPKDMSVYSLDLRKRKFEDVIRTERPDAIVHLGMIRHFKGDPKRRHDVNVRGTKQMLDHSVEYGVKKVVVVSSGYVYGAFPENPFYLDEEQPLSASRSYPEIRDLVEVDSLAGAFLWKYPHIRTAVLRPVNVLGANVSAMIANYLRRERVPTVLGFDPMMQFLHEADMTEAIAQALEQGLQGVFNVVGPGQVPLHTAIRETGGRATPILEPLFRPAIRMLFGAGVVPWPPGALDFLKFPVTLSGKRFAEATGFQPLFGLAETFASLREGRS
ncbi:MAG: NAD-dependent epimerase/dehydratase family protein [Deltaproteobacteria bacterium]|nr:NAD-dependent epimerase/dehydratase family protein [Deltaproteobacteria bacterium]MBW2393628.1 NAD-dependent epimerase/dehydratase family protein [Deltaproteobacteria bacterium]